MTIISCLSFDRYWMAFVRCLNGLLVISRQWEGRFYILCVMKTFYNWKKNIRLQRKSTQGSLDQQAFAYAVLLVVIADDKTLHSALVNKHLNVSVNINNIVFKSCYSIVISCVKFEIDS